MRPAAVVKRRKTPGCVILPGPTPRRDPGPLSLLVWRPVARLRHVRHPDFAVCRVVAPGAIGIEVFIARDFARDVACRYRIVFRPIAARDPLVETVERRRGTDLRFLQIRARETRLF